MAYDYYESILNDFKMNWKWLADEIEDYRPRGDHTIRIYMKDGSQITYNGLNHSARFDRERTASEITDNYCRTDFSSKLRDYMDRRGFDQISLAQRSGLSQGSIGKYLRKESTPTLTAVYKLARALECTVGELTE